MNWSWRMKLHREWKTIAKKAWSMRLMAIATVLSGVEVILPLFSDAFPRWIFASASMAVTMGAMVSRIVSQNNLNGVCRGDD